MLPKNENCNKAFSLLKKFENQFPGSNIELRVPEVGAVQFGSGSKHRRGIPPNVVEIECEIFISLCEKTLLWQEAMERGDIFASGVNSNISNYFDKLEF